MVVLQTRAVPPAEGAAEREDEEQRPGGPAQTHKHSPMEAAGGELSLSNLNLDPFSSDSTWQEHLRY